jgi:hypothetical protein
VALVASVDGNTFAVTIAVTIAVAIARYEILDAVLRTKWDSRCCAEHQHWMAWRECEGARRKKNAPKCETKHDAAK